MHCRIFLLTGFGKVPWAPACAGVTVLNAAVWEA
jgi:hypothetical protein